MNLEEKVRKIIADTLSKSESEIKAESSLTEDLGADSLEIVELAMAMEEEFSIEIPDEDIEKIATVKDIIDYINEHRAES
jgi:acyl carrier protein